MSERYIKFIPSEFADWLQENYPNAFLLLALIARKTQRNTYDGLEVGEAEISFQSSGIDSYKKYRSAKEKLVELKIIEISNTNRKNNKMATSRATSSSVVKLLSSSIWDVNLESEGNLKGNLNPNKPVINSLGQPQGQPISPPKFTEKGNLDGNLSLNKNYGATSGQPHNEKMGNLFPLPNLEKGATSGQPHDEKKGNPQQTTRSKEGIVNKTTTYPPTLHPIPVDVVVFSFLKDLDVPDIDKKTITDKFAGQEEKLKAILNLKALANAYNKTGYILSFLDKEVPKNPPKKEDRILINKKFAEEKKQQVKAKINGKNIFDVANLYCEIGTLGGAFPPPGIHFDQSPSAFQEQVNNALRKIGIS